MKNVLILQNNIFPYRKDLFNKLSDYYNITILHSGEVSKNENDKYTEIITKTIKAGPLYFQLGVRDELRKVNYDVIIAMFDIRWINNILALYVHKSMKFIYWGHRYSKYSIVNLLREKLLKKSDAVLLYSDKEIKRLIDAGILKNKIFVANNTIYVGNSKDFSTHPKNSFLFVGRAQKRKRVDILIKAFYNTLQRLPDNVTLDIVGSGKENEKLIKLVESLGLKKRIKFHGQITEEDDLIQYFKKAFAYVSPGPVGLGVLHSLAYGVPVVTNINGKHGPEFDNIVHNENGLTYSTNGELEKILISLAQEKSLSKKLGKNAYNYYSQKRKLEQMAQGFIDAIESTI